MKMLITFALTFLLFGCAINDPVQTQSVVDDRPRLTFDVSDSDPQSLELYIDGISYGSVIQYLNTTSSVRILPGQHEIEVTRGSQTVYQATQYFGESTLTEIGITTP